MTRRKSRKRNDSGVIDIPWQITLLMAIFVFAVLRWFIPMLVKSVVLLPLVNMISGFAPMAALFIVFIGGISFLRNIGSASPALAEDTSAANYPIHERALMQPNADLHPYTSQWGTKPNITDWSLDLLRSLEWKRFEILCAEYFLVLGKRVETISHGADGGLDARVYKKNSDVMEFAIQCKAWDSMVGVKPVRELFGVMAHESAGKGIFMATSRFSDDAKQFAEEHKDKLFLIDGEKFLSMISMLPEEKREKLLALSAEGDYTTPTCASCGIKMIRRMGKSSEFWGCKNYPKCRSILKIVTP